MRSVRERAGFEEYVDGCQQQLLRAAYALTGDWHKAQDLVQMVLTKLYVDWPRVQRADSVDAYARRCLVNAFVDEGRRPWRRDVPGDIPERPAREPTAPSDDRLELVAALAQVPRRQRAVLVLRYLLDLDVATTAHALGCSTGNVKSQTARGLDALRQILRTTEGELL